MLSLGFITGIILTVLLVFGFALAASICNAWYQHETSKGGYYNDAGFAKGCELACTAGILLTLLLAALFFYPYHMEYHEIRNVQGTVTQVSNRFLAGDNGGTNQKFVVTINGKQYGCNDTRCSLVHVGSWLQLGCQRVWEFGSKDGYDCVFRGIK